MVGSDMDVSEKLKSLSIDRAGSAKPAGGWKMAAIAGAGVALVGVAWALLGRGPAEPPVQAANVSAPTPGAAAAEAAANRPRGGLVASGYVVARRSATVSVDITGRLTDVLFEEGAVVEKGQILARLDADLAQYDLELTRGRLQSAKATISSIEAQMPEAEAQRQRVRSCFSVGL